MIDPEDDRQMIVATRIDKYDRNIAVLNLSKSSIKINAAVRRINERIEEILEIKKRLFALNPSYLQNAILLKKTLELNNNQNLRHLTNLSAQI